MNSAAHLEPARFIELQINGLSDWLLPRVERHVRRIDVEVVGDLVVIHDPDRCAHRNGEVVRMEVSIPLADHG